MYRIYLKRRLFILTSASLDRLSERYPDAPVHHYTGEKDQIKSFIKTAKKTRIGESIKPKEIILRYEDIEQLKADFFSAYRIIEAAGGLVYNSQNEILFIYRRGHWDLPKGKIDPGEVKEDTSVREVLEETGLEAVERHEWLHTSYHIYKNKDKTPCLKPTYWYKMTTQHDKLKLQHEEDIEKAEWLTAEDFLAQNRVTYVAIRDVIEMTI